MLIQVPYDKEKVLQSIDSGMDVFGTTVKTVVYFRMKSLYHLERGDILQNPEAFAECIENFFGAKAVHVEKAIVSSLMLKLLLPEIHLGDHLPNAITKARNLMPASK